MPKPLLLVFPFDLLSHQVRCVRVAQALSAQYDIRFAASRKWAWVYQEQGFGEFPFTGFDPAAVMRDASRFSFDWLRAEETARVAGEIRALLKAMKPARVLGDAMPVLRLAAQAERVPSLNLINAYMSPAYARPRRVPAGHPAHFIQPLLPLPLFRWGESRKLRKVHAAFLQLRKQWNLPLVDSFLHEWQGDHTLICDDAQLFPLHSLPEAHLFTGPLRLPMTRHQTETAQAIDFLQNAPRNRRIVVSMGSSGDLERVKTLRSPLFADYRIVIAGEGASAWNESHLRSWPLLNLAQLMPHAALVISHGGNGTLYEALLAGLPVLSSPVHFEQGWNAQAAQAAGVGETLPRMPQAQQLRQVVDRWAGRALPLQVSDRAQEALSQLPDWLNEAGPGLG